MIRLTKSTQFNENLDSVLEWLHLRALEDGKDPEQLQANFQSEFIKTIRSLHSNPFVFQAYGPNNPTRRAIFFFGSYVIEYQLIPSQVKTKDNVEEIILTTLLPTKSDQYKGANEEMEQFVIDFNKES